MGTQTTTKKKVLTVDTSDGATWQIPLELIAESRAKYYGENDPDPDYDTTYKQEFEYTMDDEDIAIEWYQNNMHKSELTKHAVLTYQPAKPVFDSDVEDEDVYVEILSIEDEEVEP